MSKKAIRAAFKQLLSDEGVLASGSILLSKYDRVGSDKLPVIRIYPSSGQSERVAVNSYGDSYSIIIEVEAKTLKAKAVDDALDDFVDAITDAIRSGSETLNDLLHDYEVTSSNYTFDAETGDEVGSVTIEVECELKP